MHPGVCVNKQYTAYHDHAADMGKSGQTPSSQELVKRYRPAHLTSPDDTPLRDANREFLLGVLTVRWVVLTPGGDRMMRLRHLA